MFIADDLLHNFYNVCCGFAVYVICHIGVLHFWKDGLHYEIIMLSQNFTRTTRLQRVYYI